MIKDNHLLLNSKIFEKIRKMQIGKKNTVVMECDNLYQVKKAILLSFRLNVNEVIKAPHASWFDKVPSKTVNWTQEDHERAGFRYVPDAVVRLSLIHI